MLFKVTDFIMALQFINYHTYICVIHLNLIFFITTSCKGSDYKYQVPTTQLCIAGVNYLLFITTVYIQDINDILMFLNILFIVIIRRLFYEKCTVLFNLCNNNYK